MLLSFAYHTWQFTQYWVGATRMYSRSKTATLPITHYSFDKGVFRKARMFRIISNVAAIDKERFSQLVNFRGGLSRAT
jgi:hypothetical protein